MFDEVRHLDRRVCIHAAILHILGAADKLCNKQKYYYYHYFRQMVFKRKTSVKSFDRKCF